MAHPEQKEAHVETQKGAATLHWDEVTLHQGLKKQETLVGHRERGEDDREGRCLAKSLCRNASHIWGPARGFLEQHLPGPGGGGGVVTSEVSGPSTAQHDPLGDQVHGES